MKRVILIGLAAALVGMLALPAMAAVTETTATENFTGFDADTHLTQTDASDNGWRYVEDQGVRDVAIVSNGIDGNSLRMSNAVADGNFGNWVYSQRLTTPVTEDADGNQFIAEFKIESETGDVPAWSAALGLASVGLRCPHELPEVRGQRRWDRRLLRRQPGR